MAAIEPWPEPVDGAELAKGLQDLIRRFVVIRQDDLTATAFWVLLTHFIDIATHAPRLAVLSPQPRCGKTTLLRVLEELVPRPLSGDDLSPAVLFRLAELFQPTFLLDEADSQLARSNPNYEAVVGLLNSGHTRGRLVWRMVGEGSKMQPKGFKIFARLLWLVSGNSMQRPWQTAAFESELERRLTTETVRAIRV